MFDDSRQYAGFQNCQFIHESRHLITLKPGILSKVMTQTKAGTEFEMSFHKRNFYVVNPTDTVLLNKTICERHLGNLRAFFFKFKKRLIFITCLCISFCLFSKIHYIPH